MNPRSISEKTDDGIMGEIASVAVMQFLKDHGRNVVSYDQIRKDEYRNPDPGWDVLSSHQTFTNWFATTDNVMLKPPFAHSFSIKSSRIPKADSDDVYTSIGKRDFKIFKKSESIGSDLTADFEVQVYYSLRRSGFTSTLLISMDDVFGGEIDRIISKLRLMDRYSNCYISGAASRESLISYSESLPEELRYWSSYHNGYEKLMWKAPLHRGISFQNIS